VPSVEEYLVGLGSLSTGRAAALIYHAFCLAEAAGLNPEPADYIHRFPEHDRSLRRLFSLHRVVNASQLLLWDDPEGLPRVGDEIGPFVLLRELGEGGFARVFLAEQSDLGRRLVVVKVSTRITPEPWLLAQARHSHIVEVLWHSLIEDGSLQVICMPFLGGATLAAILADRRRRGGKPCSGRDLLGELDRVSAPEYPRFDLGLPAREIIARLSYPKAVAWIVARLAGALDHAYSRGVLHGDIKPSNVLLTAAGEPMLLDFNLAVGWQCAGSNDLPVDLGGTLAYMAPERLRAVSQPEVAARPTAADRHRADLYSLGMVLFETLTGHTPDHPQGSLRAPRELAAAFALSRQQGVDTLIRSGRLALAPGLRSILTRCLAPDPAERYHRACELAEDLERWSSDRSLAFAREPHWRFGLRRWVHRRRRAVAAAGLSLVVAAISTLAVWSASQTTLREKALAKLAQLWDDTERNVFRFRQFGRWRIENQDSPEEVVHHLAYYHVLEGGDWRSREEFRALPEFQRDELEIWLLEQSLRLAQALGRRPSSPGDWRRGLEILDRTVALRPLGPLETQRQLLRRQLGLPDVTIPHTSESDQPPHWMEEYLLGVEAEPLRASDALAHYQNVLRERPESFWGHYRAASVSYRIGPLEDAAVAAADHLGHCLAQRPENPALRVQLAGLLYYQHRFDAALESCNKALALHPDHAEAYRTRAFIRERLGQGESSEADLNRFELLTHRLGKIPTWRLRLDWLFFPRSGRSGVPDRDLTGSDLPERLLTADPDDVDLRTALASELMNRFRFDAALGQLDQILKMNPDHLWAHYLRGKLLFKTSPTIAHGDLSYLLDHPRFEELLQETGARLRAFSYDSSALLRTGEADKAIQVARRGLEYARKLDNPSMQGELHYALARAYAAAAKSSPDLLQQASGHLFSASLYDRKYLGSEGFREDPQFEGLRTEIELKFPELREEVD
jgi:serine/threonine protein kinase/tetratricopeptide (TPR) repeat protein